MRRLLNRRRSPAGKARGKSVEFPAGATLFDARGPSRHVYLLRSGQVRLEGDRGAIIDYLGKGDVFGEKALLGRPAAGLSAKGLSRVELNGLEAEGRLVIANQTDWKASHF